MPGSTALRLAGAIAATIALQAAAAEPAAPAPSSSDHYYPVRELDVRPGITKNIEPEYPAAAARRSLSGKVVIRLYIDEKGSVERVQTLRANPPGVFERSAERAFRAAHFTPGMKAGHAVKTKMTIEVSYDSPPPPALHGGAR
jgi:protein TonB